MPQPRVEEQRHVQSSQESDQCQRLEAMSVKKYSLKDYQIYHDAGLEQQLQMSGIDIEKQLKWAPIWDTLAKDRLFPKHFMPLIRLNFMRLQNGKPDFLMLFGMNSDQLDDFNTAFMMFGVRERQFGQFYKRIMEAINTDDGRIPLPDELLSLGFVDKQSFIKYTGFYFEF